MNSILKGCGCTFTPKRHIAFGYISVLLIYATHAYSHFHEDPILEGRATDKCYTGTIQINIIEDGVVYFMCIKLGLPRSPIFPPTQTPPIYIPPITVEYYAGICKTALSNLPFPIATIRHDDIQSYRKLTIFRYREVTSGFFAIDADEAIDNALTYFDILARYGREQIIYTPGELRHRSESVDLCPLPLVTRDLFYAYRRLAITNKWSNYHLIKRNCQHWARHVDSLALKGG